MTDTYIDWHFKGPSINTCNCDWGCPCQFSALPTHGDCQASTIIHIDEGHFGDVDLSGLNMGGMFRWPEAIHLGNGEVLAMIDERATEDQRNAMLAILTGQETVPGATIFNVFSNTYTKIHEPIFTKIDFVSDYNSRTATVRVPELLKVDIEPIRNMVTNETQEARVILPGGFEYHEASYASGTAKTSGAMEMQWTQAHAHLVNMDIGTNGVVH